TPCSWASFQLKRCTRLLVVPTASALCHLTPLLGLVCLGCVTGAQAHPSSYEAASGPPPEPSAPSAGQLLVTGGERSASEGRALDERGQSAQPPSGYWHWNGVDYVWVERKPAPKKAPYTWR
ncbi:MAG: hypothetical protein JW940_33210, partial [Polyangiaceae bacterium]|nr:hypothetical protein [Polyangiaceae bacterium]